MVAVLLARKLMQYFFLLYRHECFTEEKKYNTHGTVHPYNTRKIHTKLHPRLDGVFSISSPVRVLMMSFPAFSRLLMQTVGEKWQAIYLSI